MGDLIIVENNQAVTSSLTVAEEFDRQHRHVLDSIKDIFEKDAEKAATLFYETTYIHEQNKQQYRMYLMNRDGFAVLAMGFTGDKALKFKFRFLDRFNEMEERLKQQQAQSQFQLPQTYKDALLQLVEKVEENEQLQTQNLVLEQRNKELQPKATYYDVVLQNNALLSVSKISKDYGLGPASLNKKLNELGVQYKQGGVWLLYAKYQDKGYTTTKTFADNGHVHTYWTQKGRLFIYELLKRNGILPMIEQQEEAWN